LYYLIYILMIKSILIKFKLKLYITCLSFLFLLNSVVINAQILRDSLSLNLVKKSIDNLYNLQFKEADEEFSLLRKAFPGHPVIYLLEGLKTYWENYPMSPSSPSCVSFENDLRRCIELCEGKNQKAEEAELLLANLSARGMLLLFYDENDLTMEVIPLAASTYPFIRRSFGYTTVYTDFFFFTGLYNYTRAAFPEAYPVYKTFAFLFPRGDRQKGLSELQQVAKNSILFKAESSLFLSGISLSIENNYEKACYYSKSLHELYPANPEYLGIYLKNLLLIKQYDEAEKLMKSSANITNSFLKSQIDIFNGILQEKKYKNDKLAEQYYIKGVHDISLFGYFGNEFAAYGYFGLSRISGRSGDINYKKTYLKKALELADFKNITFD
jgi:hypothetical protein